MLCPIRRSSAEPLKSRPGRAEIYRGCDPVWDFCKNFHPHAHKLVTTAPTFARVFSKKTMGLAPADTIRKNGIAV
jgi:hypothetical protein